jgi:hypothetical protein
VGLLVLAIAGVCRPASAHVKSASWSTWAVDGEEAAVRVRVSRGDLSERPRFARLAESPGPDDEQALETYLEQSIRAEGPSGPCPVAAASRRVLAGEDGFLLRAWRVRCRGGGPVRIVSDLLVSEIPSHLHFAVLEREDGSVAERLLTRESPEWPIGRGEAASTGILDFVGLGIRHVATGPDHIVFVLALLVAASSLRAVAGVVTGFTLGHSVTLALAVLGGVRPDVSTVEALVGASIAVVAVENVWLERRDPWVARGLVVCLCAVAAACGSMGRSPALALAGLALFVACYHGLLARMRRPARLRWTIAALFGTVHGLAFSGALAEMHLPRARLAGALFGFNVGVEMAQLALVGLAWPLWRILSRTRARTTAIDVTSAAALGAGAFWLIDRAFRAP